MIITSELIKKNVVCPKCRQQTETGLLCSINTESEKDALKKVLDDEFFKWECDKCGFQTMLLHPLLYSDIKNKFMVYYIPNVERSRISDEKLELEFKELSDIRKRLVPDINALKEKIMLFGKGFDDASVELAKLAVSEVVGKSTGQTVYEGYCTEIDKSSNVLSFQFFIGGKKRPYMQTTRFDVYKRSFDIVKEYFPDLNEQGGFLNIDRSWAKEALRKYKDSE